MKKDDAGGIGNFCEFVLISDMRRGRAPILLPVSASSSSVSLDIASITIRTKLT